MEVILREHVDHLGRRGDLVKVADGYARNYLLPRKLALLATDGNRKQIERERAKFEIKELEEQIHATEHTLLPEAIRMIASGRVRIDDQNPRLVRIDPATES